LSAPGPVRFRLDSGLCPAATPSSQRGQSFASGSGTKLVLDAYGAISSNLAGDPFLRSLSPLQTVGNQGPAPHLPSCRHHHDMKLMKDSGGLHMTSIRGVQPLSPHSVPVGSRDNEHWLLLEDTCEPFFLRSSLLRCRSPGKKGMTRRGNRKVKGNQFRPLLGIASNSDALAARACHRHTTTTMTTCTMWYNARPHCCSLGGSRKLVCRSAGRGRPLVRIGRLARPENRCCGFAIRGESLVRCSLGRCVHNPAPTPRAEGPRNVGTGGVGISFSSNFSLCVRRRLSSW